MGTLVVTPKPTFPQRIAHRLGFGTIIDPSVKSVPKSSDPITITVSTKVTSQKWNGYSKQAVLRDYAHRCEIDIMRRENGPAATVIDAYNHALWTNGWRIESKDAMLADMLTAKIQKMHAENTLKMLTEDGLSFGYGVAERAFTAGDESMGLKPQMAVVVRSARQFDILIDKRGIMLGIRQYNEMGEPMKDVGDLPMEKAIVLMPMISSEGSGRSLIDQCWDPLLWWKKISEACADAIQRHGNTIFDIQIAGPDGQLAPIDAMTGMEGITTDLNSKAELVTNINTQIKELNQAGVPHVQTYGNWVLQQICAASGAPEELFGLGAGKTGLLAVSKWAIFYDKLASIQHTLEPQIDDQLIDPLLESMGKAPGDAHFVFSNPNTSNDSDKADFCKKLMDIDPMSPIVDHQWILDYLGIKTPKNAPPSIGGEDPGLTG